MYCTSIFGAEQYCTWTMRILGDLSKLCSLPQEKSKPDYLLFDSISGNFYAVSV